MKTLRKIVKEVISEKMLVSDKDLKRGKVLAEAYLYNLERQLKDDPEF